MKLKPIRICHYCRSGFERDRYPCGTLEQSRDFAKRRFCNATCRGLYERDRSIQKARRVLRRLELEQAIAKRFLLA
jgi:hypothetical protein